MESRNWGGFPFPNRYATEFAEKFAAYHGARYGCTLTNGTVALVVALQAAGIRFGDEVIVPAYTWDGTATAVLFAGAVALIGAFAMSYQLGAELLNFGAILGFLGVNLSAFVHFFVRGKRTFGNFALPLGGFAICFVLWIRLRWPALVAGFIWLGAGLVYTAFKTNGFRKPLAFSEIPEE